MGKDKLRRFAEITAFENVIELEDGKVLKGQWAEHHFKNNNPLILELGCGKGEYTVNLARLYPEINFIGIDYKGNRIWRGAKTAIEEDISNVAFLRIQIENLLDYFSENEVAEIWITFPDPQPQISREKKRLTSGRFLDMYRIVLQKGGPVHLKTDSDLLYIFTVSKIKELGMNTLINTDDLYKSPFADHILSIKTYYEKKYLANDKNINYLKFSFE
ncbi:MAG: tRNA (guanosine(46)-N7)-methyltransferase TrmB [Daejeonella sp.]|uniref:tRNA (guanosine(46)-N7)-methyltransferase TrmB n=1 Tax=Daejeonella sp. TaxID=2805397 RepID=UPI002732905E|nr:tRNA (guanosine(46)-N7)-methyltransferase TrmB [Daejeonella sp.]MDP3467184.1 tRNA (guanosine(46)-N7)-methyltransferase TrmB [Daejeonella sp.]